MQKIFKMQDKVFMGLTGLATDIQTVQQQLQFRVNMYNLREERDIEASTFGNMVCGLLYERRFGPYFVEPIIAGLEGEDNTPFICGMDLIGAPVFAKDFCVAGTTEDELYGTAESMFKPDLVRCWF
jgi:20S proteasome subunit beta 3